MTQRLDGLARQHTNETPATELELEKRRSPRLAFMPTSPERQRSSPSPTTVSARPLKRTKTQNDTKESAGPFKRDSDVEESVITSSTNRAYSWDALRLGDKLGSGNLNDFLERHGGPKLTTRQVLAIVSQMRPKTLIPPPGSPLHQAVHEDVLDDIFEDPPEDDGCFDEEEEKEAQNAAFTISVNVPQVQHAELESPPVQQRQEEKE